MCADRADGLFEEWDRARNALDLAGAAQCDDALRRRNRAMEALIDYLVHSRYMKMPAMEPVPAAFGVVEAPGRKRP